MSSTRLDHNLIYVQLTCSILGGISSLIVIIAWGGAAVDKIKEWWK